MFDRNALPTGLLIGIALPIVGFLVLYGLFSALESFNLMSSEDSDLFSGNAPRRSWPSL